MFAITARDGTRHYAFSRPLSHRHALVVITTAMHSAVYITASERAATCYALLVHASLGMSGSSATSLPEGERVDEVVLDEREKEREGRLQTYKVDSLTLYELFASDIWSWLQSLPRVGSPSSSRRTRHDV